MRKLSILLVAVSVPMLADVTFNTSIVAQYGVNSTTELPAQISVTCPSGNGTFSCAVLVTPPASWSAILQGDTVTNWADVYQDAFTFTNNVLTQAVFMALTFPGPDPWQNAIAADQQLALLTINTTNAATVAGGLTNPAYQATLMIATPNSTALADNQQIVDTVSFGPITYPDTVTPGSLAAPEPGTWVMGVMLAGLGILRGRKEKWNKKYDKRLYPVIHRKSAS